MRRSLAWMGLAATLALLSPGCAELTSEQAALMADRYQEEANTAAASGDKPAASAAQRRADHYRRLAATRKAQEAHEEVHGLHGHHTRSSDQTPQPSNLPQN